MALHAVCPADELPTGTHRAFEVAGTSLIVYHLEDGFYATQARCPHIFAPLAKGKLVDGCQIQCPFHRARFDVRSGAVVQWANWPRGLVDMLNVVRSEKQLATYAVRLENGQVCVELP